MFFQSELNVTGCTFRPDKLNNNRQNHFKISLLALCTNKGHPTLEVLGDRNINGKIIHSEHTVFAERGVTKKELFDEFSASCPDCEIYGANIGMKIRRLIEWVKVYSKLKNWIVQDLQGSDKTGKSVRGIRIIRE